MIRVYRIFPLAITVSVCMVPNVYAAGLDDLDVTIQVIEHREQGAGEIINRIELPRPSDADRRIDASARQDSDHSDRYQHDGAASASSVASEVRQQSTSVRENTSSVRSEAHDVSSEVRSDSVQAAHELTSEVRSTVQESSSDIRSTVQDASSEVRDSSRDSQNETKDNSSAQEARESATDRDRDRHDD